MVLLVFKDSGVKPVAHIMRSMCMAFWISVGSMRRSLLSIPRAHHLRVESCKWHGGSSICDQCECGEVQDKKHALFFCECAEVCELRMRYRDLFERMFKTLRVFAPSSSELIPFLTCHHSITDFEINAFLNQDSHRLLKFVSDLVSIFDTG